MASDNDSPYSAINAKLAQVLDEAPEPPPWGEAWKRLGPESTEEERLAVYQAVRAAESVPPAAGFYLVSWQIDAIALRDSAESLGDLDDRLEAIQREHGLDEDESWAEGEGPPEYEKLRQQLDDAWDGLFAAKLDKFGERELAEMFRTDREKFDQLSEVGRSFFHGPFERRDDATDWLDNLLEAVVGCMEAHSPMGPPGLRYHEEEGFWEVSIYPTPVEVVGGAHDGAVVSPGCTVDLEQLRALFDAVVEFGWNTFGVSDSEGPFVHIEGQFAGREVFLCILAEAPEDEEPGLKLDAT